jgi:twitching motility protein PilT
VDCFFGSRDPEKTKRIHDLISTGRSQYQMQTFDQSLHDLCSKDLITFAEAMKWCSNPADFELRNKGVQVTSESWEEVQQQIRDTGSRDPKKPSTTKQSSVDRFGT